jgi:hypothetical protein
MPEVRGDAAEIFKPDRVEEMGAALESAFYSSNRSRVL